MVIPPPASGSWPAVERDFLPGRWVDLRLTDPARDAAGLWQNLGRYDDVWTHIPSSGPFPDEGAFALWLAARVGKPDQQLYTIFDKTGPGEGDRGDERGRPVGLFFVLRIAPAMGTAELGLMYGPALQGSIGGTQAFHLITDYILGTLGYRRWEWRTSPENTASTRAALRFGYRYEGLQRQTMWAKGRSWDSMIYALLDHEWPAVDARLRAWLDPANFTADGRQIRRLSDC